MLFILRYTLLMAIFFCLENKQSFAGDAKTDCPQSSADDYFFLASPSKSSQDKFKRQWYSKHLRAMSEPTLSCGPSSAEETYRFLWLLSFHNPIAVRVARSNEGVQLSAVELSGAGGYEPGTIVKQLQKSLSPDQWQTLISEVEACKYWSQPSVDNSHRFR